MVAVYDGAELNIVQVQGMEERIAFSTDPGTGDARFARNKIGGIGQLYGHPGALSFATHTTLLSEAGVLGMLPLGRMQGIS
jgi:hypothetical protein